MPVRLVRFLKAVHPRLRGELSGSVVRLRTLPGSSPLTRGTLSTSSPSIISKRFIPAYAGNSEHEEHINTKSRGSSPLTRGTPVDELVATRDNRFIPAYAGNSLSTQSRKSSESVHPRLRGELLQTAILCNLNHGSSPLTRGTPHQTNPHCLQRRFIPAYAGNSPL